MHYTTIAQLHNRLFVPTDQPIEHQPLEPNFRPTKFTSAPSSVITRSLFTQMTDRPTNQSNDQRLNFFSKRHADRLTDRPAHNSSVVSSTVFPTNQIHLFSLITVSLFTRLADRPTDQPTNQSYVPPIDQPTDRHTDQPRQYQLSLLNKWSIEFITPLSSSQTHYRLHQLTESTDNLFDSSAIFTADLPTDLLTSLESISYLF